MPAQLGARRIDEDAALRAVVEGTASETGQAFYRALVRSLAGALDTRGAWLTEVAATHRTRLRALAFWMGGTWVEHFEQVIDGTPCQAVVDGRRLVHFPERIPVRALITRGLFVAWSHCRRVGWISHVPQCR